MGNMQSLTMKQAAGMALLFAVALVFAVMPDQALAGTGGASFDPIWEDLKEWMQGTLGRIISAAIVIVGIIAGVARQSLMAFAIGLFGGFGMYYTPDVLESIVMATIEHADKAQAAATLISNGL